MQALQGLSFGLKYELSSLVKPVAWLALCAPTLVARPGCHVQRPAGAGTETRSAIQHCHDQNLGQKEA